MGVFSLQHRFSDKQLFARILVERLTRLSTLLYLLSPISPINITSNMFPSLATSTTTYSFLFKPKYQRYL